MSLCKQNLRKRIHDDNKIHKQLITRTNDAKFSDSYGIFSQINVKQFENYIRRRILVQDRHRVIKWFSKREQEATSEKANVTRLKQLKHHRCSVISK